jgi:glycosyltransferase involved in cell wall biosynthesis
VRILYLCPDLGIPVLGRKGASVHVRELVAAMGRAGHRVVVAAPLLSRSPWEEPATLATPVFHVPSGAVAESVFYGLKAYGEMLGAENSVPGELRRILLNQELATQLRRRFEHEPPDFIYERGSLHATAGAVLAEGLDVPLIVELNAPLALEHSTYRAAGLGELAAQAERWMLARADAVLAVSAPVREYAISLGVAPERAHVSPNGVDPCLFQPAPPDPEVRARMGLGNGGPVLGFVGALRPWHGVEALPELLARLVPRYPDLWLVIVGDGPRRGALERELRERGLTRHAVFTGSVPHEEVAGLIRQFDVALAPYPKPEHAFYFSPLKLFEYMGCGVPVVAAALGQIGEVVRDGETGLLYPPGELDALAAACDRLLADPALRHRLGQTAAAEVHGRYTWDHNAARVVDLAHSLIAARASACRSADPGAHPRVACQPGTREARRGGETSPWKSP